MPEKPGSHRSFMDIMEAKMQRRMEKGNLFLILAAILPLVHFACLPNISVVELAGFVAYELLLVAGVAWGTKQYYRRYALPGQEYPVRTHVVAVCLCGLGTAAMVLIPSRWYVVIILWIISLVISLVCQLASGERECLWNEFTIEFAMAVRGGYLLCLAACGLVVAGAVVIRQQWNL